MTVLIEYLAPALGIPSDTWSNYASAWASMMLWIPIEAVLLATWGTTPGKFVLDIRVQGDLSFRRSLSRAVQVQFKGLAAGIPFVAIVAGIRSYKRLSARGVTAWDEALDLRVEHGPVTPLRVAAAVTLILLSLGVELATMNPF
jgi:hypothetical protein